ncbi:MAG: glycosyltransferase [Patescibacteria group bacterium]|mgnify:CR=1 FL=1
MKNNSQTKILFLINNLGVGGAEGVFLREAEALQGLGFETQIFALYPNNFRNIYDWKGYLGLVKKIKEERITHVYSTLDDANFVAKIVRIFVKFKLFCREANMTEDKSLKFKIADVALNFLVYKLVMVASAVKQSYLSYDPYHKNKMTVLYNGVFIPEITPNKEISNPIKILAVGSFTNKKGFSDLVLIIKDFVFKNHNNFVLEIVGGGPLLHQIRSQIKDFGLEEYIKCPGALDKDSLKLKYMESDIFVLTSKKEGCPNVLLEAMSYGLAPICFAVGATPEIIEKDVSGFVVSKGDKLAFGQAVVDLLKNPSKIKIIGNKARERVVAQFSFDDHAAKLQEVLQLR